MPEVTQPKQPMAPAIHSNFVTRIAGLPVIATALGTATNSYNRVKEMNGLLTYTLNTAEKSASFAVNQTIPVIQKFATPIEYVDSLACKGLDKVEESYPIVKSPPGEILSEAMALGRKTYGDAKDTGITKVNNLKTYSSEKLQALTYPAQALTVYGSELMKYANVALTATENSLDQHIATLGLEPETSDPNSNSVPLRQRFDNISRKASTCVSHHAALQFAALQKYTTDSLTKFQVALQVIQDMKANLTASDQSFRTTLTNLNVGSAWLQGLLADTDASPEGPKPLPVQALLIAQATAKQASAALHVPSAVVQHMSESVRNSYTRLTAGVSQLAHDLANVRSVNDLTTVAVTQLQQQGAALQSSLNQFTSTGFNWLASLPVFDSILRPDVEMEEVPPGTKAYSSEDSESDS
ncbi:perilipin-2-like [Ornithodoros turicata]|uniref:perilipin-2-like n=1 Tax=Ornithodoros turicata TaxID=34597 RepID=UPI0031399972